MSDAETLVGIRTVARAHLRVESQIEMETPLFQLRDQGRDARGVEPHGMVGDLVAVVRRHLP